MLLNASACMCVCAHHLFPKNSHEPKRFVEEAVCRGSGLSREWCKHLHEIEIDNRAVTEQCFRVFASVKKQCNDDFHGTFSERIVPDVFVENL